MENDAEIQLDFSRISEIGGGDDTFLLMLLNKMISSLPVAFDNMERSATEQNWQELKAAAHKAKSTFAYLDLSEIRERLQKIEHDSMEGTNLNLLPQKVSDANALGRQVLKQLIAYVEKMSS